MPKMRHKIEYLMIIEARDCVKDKATRCYLAQETKSMTQSKKRRPNKTKTDTTSKKKEPFDMSCLFSKNVLL